MDTVNIETASPNPTIAPIHAGAAVRPIDSGAAVRPRGDGSIASLNGLRALSVIMVIGSHLATSVGVPPQLRAALAVFDGYLFNGALGVHFFFCISGFLITHLLLKERAETGTIDLKTFYVRRTLRIWPVLYAFVLFLFVVSRTTALDVTSCQFATALTFTKNYGCSSWIDGHLWSLGVEFQFYLFWPAVVVFFSTRTAALVAVAAVFVSPASRLIETHAGLPLWWLTSNMDALMVGSLAAFGWRFRRDVTERTLHWRPALSRCLGFALVVVPVLAARWFPTASAQIMFGPTVQTFGATWLIVSYAFGPQGWSKAVLNSRPMNFLGVISYSLYIWQEPFFIWPSDFGFERLLTFEWPFNVAGMLLVAVASYHFLERPLLTLRRKFATPHRT